MDSLQAGKPLGKGRAELLAALAAAMDRQARIKEDMQRGQGLLFSADAAPASEPAVQAQPLPERDLLKFEKEVLGFYLSGHPLIPYRDRL
jgi:DNA polymerase-3 subunit alpha